MQELLKVKRNLAKRGGKEVDFEWNSRENAAFHGSNEVRVTFRSVRRAILGRSSWLLGSLATPFSARSLQPCPHHRTKDIAYDDQIES